MRRVGIVVLTLLLGMPVVQAAGFPEFDQPALKLGRKVWLGTCEVCHANSLSDAPQVKQAAAWTARLAQGKAVLYQNALQGKRGTNGEEMPPRGGNATLSDAEVRAAVDYMLKLINVKGDTP